MHTCLGYLFIDKSYRFVLKDLEIQSQNQISFLIIQNASKCFPDIAHENKIKITEYVDILETTCLKKQQSDSLSSKRLSNFSMLCAKKLFEK